MNGTEKIQRFDDLLSELAKRTRSTSTYVSSFIKDRLPDSRSLAERRRRLAKMTGTLTESHEKTSELDAKLKHNMERMDAKHNENVRRLANSRNQAGKIRRELAESNLPLDEVRRLLLTTESALGTAEKRVEADSLKIATARQKAHLLISKMERSHRRWESRIDCESETLEKDSSLFSRLRRAWNFVAWIIFGYLLVDRLSGRRRPRE